jgi:hypothetical protein
VNLASSGSFLLAEASRGVGPSPVFDTEVAVRRSPRDRLGLGIVAVLGAGVLLPALGSAASLALGPKTTTSGYPTYESFLGSIALGYLLASTVGPLAVFGVMDGGAWGQRALVGTLIGHGVSATLGVAGAALLTVAFGALAPYTAALWILAAFAPSVGTLVALATAPELEQPRSGAPEREGLRPSVVAFRF